MLSVGLTGGLATGKTHVARTLEELGCLVIRLDDLGHQVIDPGGEAYDAVIAEFGRDVVNLDGTIDRKALGAVVFSDPEKLTRLNALVHPAVRARAARILNDFARQHPDGIAVTEAAILIETGTYKEFDRLILAVCRPEQQIERAMHRDGLTRQQVLDRLSRQMPLEDKRKYADFVIDTSGSKEETHRQTRLVYESLKRLRA